MNPTENTLAAEPQALAASSSHSMPSMSTLALAGAGALALGALASSPAQAQTRTLRFASDVPGSGDVKVLNFALILEDLETEAYVQAVQRLTGGGSGGRDAVAGTRITGLNISDNQRDVRFLRQFTRVETQHRNFLRGALGNAAVRPFKFKFGIENMTRGQVVNLIYVLEQGGTSAYLGALPFFATKNFVPVATAIQGTEARHTAIIADVLNDLTGANVLSTPPTFSLPGRREKPATPDETLATVSRFIVTG
jgi:hypothetical protein